MLAGVYTYLVYARRQPGHRTHLLLPNSERTFCGLDYKNVVPRINWVVGIGGLPNMSTTSWCAICKKILRQEYL